MAKYLDQQGLLALWSKIKGTFVKANGGNGLYISSNNEHLENTTYTASTVQGEYLVGNTITLTNGNAIKVITSTDNTLDGYVQKFLPDRVKIFNTNGDILGSDYYENTTGSDIVLKIGYLKDSATSATLVYHLENTYWYLNLEKASGSQLGGVTLSDTANANQGASSGVAATPKAVADAIANATAKVDGVSGTEITRYGVCSTAAATATKEVTITSGSVSTGNPTTGERVTVKFANANTATSSLQLKVNTQNAKSIQYQGSNIDENTAHLLKGTVDFVYDGTYWQLIGGSKLAFDKVTIGTGSGAPTIDAKTNTTIELYSNTGITLIKKQGVDNSVQIGLGAASVGQIGGIIFAENSNNSDLLNVSVSYDPGNVGKGRVQIPKASRDKSGYLSSADYTTIMNSIASTFSYELADEGLPQIGTAEGTTPDVYKGDSFAKMYTIYFVNIGAIDVEDDEESSETLSNNKGENQSYAEYIIVDKGEDENPRFVWERLGTTDVNIDSITSNYINALN